jgi:YfiH family protein
MMKMSEHFLQPDWPAPPQIKAYTTLRQSQVKPASPLLKQLLSLPEEPIWIRQTHSTIVLKATADHTNQEADATFTNETNQVCAILTADCLPILLCNRQGTYVAAIHAGWRGLANGIIETALDKLKLPADDILIWLGPAIGPTRFEVRKDVYDTFTLNNPDAVPAFTPIGHEHWLANLYLLARQRLQQHGITHIYGGEFCTYSDPERFFSYRRDNQTTDRIISLIWIADTMSNAP